MIDNYLQTCIELTPAPVLSDVELNAWGDLFQVERLAGRMHFDAFVANPVRACIRLGVMPRPYDIGSAPTENERRLLQIQRHIAGGVAW
jgi:hypothetical protein